MCGLSLPFNPIKLDVSAVPPYERGCDDEDLNPVEFALSHADGFSLSSMLSSSPSVMVSA